MFIIGVFVVVIAIAAGIYLGNLGNRDRPARTERPGPSADCQSACSLFQTRQQEACLAQRAAEAADRHAENMRLAAIAVGVGSLGPVGALIGGIIAASITATVASGGTLAPATIAAIVLGIAIAAIAALILFPVVVALITAAVTAAIVASNKRQEALDAVAARNEARQTLFANCSVEEANACLNIPFVC
jgi:hypothetical protein